ncbi:unnamed protein product [Plutella xylostella]|uniref:(diamondback moth) hypothetical protein n=1 Tax=Plutella xylostella TaxID=51655 RepID=A0A8S4GBZ6_PLUXY|nr:unnamed protein product [Plutella xylostella]
MAGARRARGRAGLIVLGLSRCV